MNKKGFNIVVFLIIMVILSVLLILLVPTVYDFVSGVRRQYFIENVNKKVDKIEELYKADSKSLPVSKPGIYVYNLKTDLSNEKDDINGYIVVDARDSNVKYYLYANNNTYQILKREVGNNNSVPTKNEVYNYNILNWDGIKSEFGACQDAIPSSTCMNRHGYILAQ